MTTSSVPSVYLYVLDIKSFLCAHNIFGSNNNIDYQPSAI